AGLVDLLNKIELPAGKIQARARFALAGAFVAFAADDDGDVGGFGGGDGVIDPLHLLLGWLLREDLALGEAGIDLIAPLGVGDFGAAVLQFLAHARQNRRHRNIER